MKQAALILLVPMVACTAPQPPAELLPREKFEQVLLEAELVEARVNHEMVMDKRTDSPIRAYYDSLFVSQGVTEAQFKTTFRYYSERPEEFKAIYQEILDKLAQRKDSLRTEMAPR